MWPCLEDHSPHPDPVTRRPQLLSLVLGLHALRDPGLSFQARAAILHPKYKPAPQLENDLALLQVRVEGGGSSDPEPRPPSLGPLPPAPPVSCSWTGR